MLDRGLAAATLDALVLPLEQQPGGRFAPPGVGAGKLSTNSALEHCGQLRRRGGR